MVGEPDVDLIVSIHLHAKRLRDEVRGSCVAAVDLELQSLVVGC